MSEYQYYEFRAIDRALTKAEMAEMRQISTRAQISPTSFVNEYNYGDFKSDPNALMFKWYDAHVYTANWGTHVLLFAMPENAIDIENVKQYLSTDFAGIQVRDRRVLTSFTYSSEGGDIWNEWGSDVSWMDELIQLRADLLKGDNRALYLGWLHGIREFYEYPEDGDDTICAEVEPPLPPGLRQLSPPLEALIEFMNLDQDLVAVAAQRSADLTQTEPTDSDVSDWIRGLPSNEKDELLVRVFAGETAGVSAEMSRRFRAGKPVAAQDAAGGRTLGQLIEETAVYAAERKRKEEAAAARKAAKLAQENERKRNEYLDSISAGREAIWSQLESHASAKPPKYDLATQLLTDLRELAEREHTTGAFDARLLEFREQHGKKPSLMKRLDDAGLIA